MEKLLQTVTFEYENNYYESTRLVALIIEQKKLDFSLFESIKIVFKRNNIELENDEEVRAVETQLTQIFNAEGKSIESIKYKKVLFSGHGINKAFSYLAFLFNVNYFFILFLMLLIFNISFFYFIPVVESFDVSYLTVTIVSLFSILLLHEFGHSISTYFFTGSNGAIGAGLFMGAMPVLYTDVSRIWMIPKKQRIIVNLSGVYFQFFINCILIICYFYFKFDFIINIIYTSTLIIFYSLIPFFKSDGYWVYSDFFNIKNLAKKSNEFIRSPFFFNKEIKLSLKVYALIEYVLKTYLVILYIINWKYFFGFFSFEKLNSSSVYEILIVIIYTILFFKLFIELLSIIYEYIRKLFK